jgi:ATP-dependent Clp protease protease subunit
MESRVLKMADEMEVQMDELLTVLRGSSRNTPVPAPEFSHIENLGVDLEKRELYVMDEIDEAFGSWFTMVMRYLEAQSHDPITIWLCTPGGSVESMFTFHDIVQTSPCDITIIATGQVCSAGVLMLACGHRRLVTESTILMSHRGEGEFSGNIEQAEAQLKVMKWQEEHWADLMARYTPDTGPDGRARDQKHWFKLGAKNAEWWIMGGKAIVDEGLADGIFGVE